MTEYELYQGEEYLGEGNTKELSEKLGINRNSIYEFASERVHGRTDEYSNQKIAFPKNLNKVKVKRIKSTLERKIDTVVELYFEGFDLKTILKTMEEL